MTRRLVSALLIIWLLGMVLFAVSLPRATQGRRTDAVIVLTGAPGRIGRGLEVMEQGLAPRMLVTGVDRDVKPGEFAAEYAVAEARMTCCITLDYSALDTRGNAQAASEWVRQRHVRSLRLVTSDWHMRRAAMEFRRHLPSDVIIIEDSVETRPSMRTLVLEYHKYLARQLERLWN